MKYSSNKNIEDINQRTILIEKVAKKGNSVRTLTRSQISKKKRTYIINYYSSPLHPPNIKGILGSERKLS